MIQLTDLQFAGLLAVALAMVLALDGWFSARSRRRAASRRRLLIEVRHHDEPSDPRRS